jgi:hypothetical protein
LRDFDCQHCKSLVNVVVKLSSDPGAFLLLCLNQLAAHIRERSFSQFELRDVDTNPDVTDKGTILIKPRHSNVENPSILSVMPQSPILHPEFLSPIKGLRVVVEAPLQIFGVNPFCPTVPKLEDDGTPGEVQPRLIDVGTEFVNSRRPN